MSKYKKISAEEYWNKYLKNALYYSSWLPENLLYLITWSNKLQKYIDNEIIADWYKDKDNLDNALDNILYEYGVDTRFISQHNNVRDLEDLINEYYDIMYIEYDDEHIYIKEK